MQMNQDQIADASPHKNSTNESRLLVIKREFNVPVKQLYSAFTTAAALKIWWWPKGLYAEHIELDFREGGKYFINLEGSKPKTGGGMVGTFEEIVENELIVMSDQFADEDGRAISAQQAKMPGVWPELIYITFEFAAVGVNASRFELSQEGIPNDMQKDCVQGWSQSFDKLESYLTNQKQ